MKSKQSNIFGEVIERSGNRLPDVDIFITGAVQAIPICCVITSFGFQPGTRSDHNLSCGNCKLNFMDSSVVTSHIMSKVVWKPKHSLSRTVNLTLNGAKFPQPGIGVYSLITAASMTNLYNYVTFECDGM